MSNTVKLVFLVHLLPVYIKDIPQETENEWIGLPHFIVVTTAVIANYWFCIFRSVMVSGWWNV